MTQQCNCGGEMESGDLLGYPKLFSCRQCGATLIVDTKGIQKWFSADGKQGTYCPKSEKEDKSNVLF
jgi:hypothetical protein